VADDERDVVPVVPGEVRDDDADIGYVFGKAIVAKDASRLVASPAEC
jgi:hypothetical protein